MQFNSYVFILLFLPITLLLYFLTNKIHSQIGKLVLVIASIYFYAYLDWSTLIVFGISLAINYVFSRIVKKTGRGKKFFLAVPIVVNVGLLLYFKYINFAITNINQLFGADWSLKELVLPLGISFFTFQQIAYVVAIYKNEIEHDSLLDYLAFILYFPKILMGPLMDPVDFITQLNDKSRKKINWDNLAQGVKIFCFGLFKKVMLADVFAGAVSWGFSNMEIATAADWILVMLFYTFEIYFDFSGYSDMAVGASLMLNIQLPINFDSPYKALSIRDFWKRWHISLTRFFTKYIYIPLGGSRKGKLLTYVNTIIVFLISGLWHGANWTYILWGAVFGVLMVADRICEKVIAKVIAPVRWVATFGIINVLWLLFRSETIEQWKQILGTVVKFQNTTISEGLLEKFVLTESSFLNDVLHLNWFTGNIRGFWMLVYLLVGFIICLIPENNYKNIKKLTVVSMILAFVAFIWGVICLSGESVFVYFNF